MKWLRQWWKRMWCDHVVIVDQDDRSRAGGKDDRARIEGNGAVEWHCPVCGKRGVSFGSGAYVPLPPGA